MADIKDDINDNELDKAFKQGIEPMEVEPSDAFWQKAETNILAKENSLFRQKLFSWKAIASSFAILVILSGFYIWHLQSRFSLIENKLLTNAIIPQKEVPDVVGLKENSKITPALAEKRPESGPTLEVTNEKRRESIIASIPKHEQTVIALKNNSYNAAFSTQKSIAPMLSTTKETIAAIEEKENTKEITENNNLSMVKNHTIPVLENTALIKKNVSLDSTQKTIEESKKDEEIVKVDSLGSKNLFAALLLPDQLAEKSEAPESASFISRLYMYGFFSPSIHRQSLKDNNSNDNINVEEVDGGENEQMSYSAGIKLGYDLMKNWSVQTGCNYFTSSVKINPTILYTKPGTNGQPTYSLITSSGVVEIPSDASNSSGDTISISNNSTQTLSFISIPFQLAYNLPLKRFIFYASSGISANILLQSETNIKFEDNGNGDDQHDDSFNNIEGLKKTHYGFSFSIGAKYMITRKLFLSAEPSFCRALTSINKNAPIQSRPYVWGLGVGIGYHF